MADKPSPRAGARFVSSPIAIARDSGGETGEKTEGRSGSFVSGVLFYGSGSKGKGDFGIFERMRLLHLHCDRRFVFKRNDQIVAVGQRVKRSRGCGFCLRGFRFLWIDFGFAGKLSQQIAKRLFPCKSDGDSSACLSQFGGRDHDCQFVGVFGQFLPDIALRRLVGRFENDVIGVL